MYVYNLAFINNLTSVTLEITPVMLEVTPVTPVDINYIYILVCCISGCMSASPDLVRQ